MTLTSAAPLGIAETERIAALLAEVMPHAAPFQPPTLPPDAITQSVRSFRQAVPPPPLPASSPEPPPLPVDPPVIAIGGVPVIEILGKANWRNESPEPVVAKAEAGPELPPPATEPGPLPAPFGVLTMSTLFGLVNWRNRPDEIRPLPLIEPPPPPGNEHTVAAMMPMFGWEE
jgi:hypothetical protein